MVTTPDGIEIAVQEWGAPTGPEIVFIHGFSLSHLCWSFQVTSSSLAHCRIVTYDLRGHGNSAKPEGLPYYREGVRWADELQTVLDHAGLFRPVLVPWSYGGRIVGDYLAQYGTARLAGINVVASKSNMSPAFASAMGVHQGAMASADLDTNIRGTIAFVEGCARGWDAALFHRTLAMAMIVPPAIRAAMMGRPLDLDDTLRTIDIPIRLTHGLHDAVIPVDAAYHAHRITPGSSLSIFEEAGHAPFLESPDRFNRELADFVAACRR